MENLLRLILRRNEVDPLEVRNALKAVERDQRSNRIAVRRWERKRKQIVERLKQARGAGSSVEVDSLWDEFKEHRREGVDLRLAGRAFGTEGLALRRTLRAVESLDRREDRAGARKLLARLRQSGLIERLGFDREESARSLEEMNQILEECSGQSDGEAADPEKALFLAELDVVRRNEAAGKTEEASQLEEELLERFQQQEPEPER
ncbi:MAG: hypothetical protein ACKVX7_00345 [Planctomycetota bacterium]